jgi:LysM repeat protein
VTPEVPPPVAPPVVPPVVEPTTGGQEYVIQKGDTFGTLAKKFNVNVKAIEKANPGVDSRRLKIKQKIQIPAPTPPSAPPATGATTGASPTDGAAAAGGTTYVVQSGDSLYKIAKKHGVKIDALRKANHLATDRIKVNQKLILPTKGAPVEPAPTAPTAPTAPPVPSAGATPGMPPTGTPPA